MKKSRRTKETLHHFSCDICGRWWTIGDVPRVKKVWFCPWCGKEQRK